MPHRHSLRLPPGQDLRIAGFQLHDGRSNKSSTLSTFGFSPDLNAAMGDALDAMLTWLQASYKVSKATALALASPVLDLRVTQVANQSWGVHALLPAGAIS